MVPTVKNVSLAGCQDYEPSNVQRAVERSFDLLGGLGAFVKGGQRVVIKPNLLQVATPEKCVTTHPAIVHAVAKMLIDHGCEVTLADSPGGGLLYSRSTLRKVYAASGYDEVAEELGFQLNFSTGYREVPNPGGRLVKHFLVIDPVMEADAVVVLSKAKTHMLTTMTGAAKNIFGVVPSLEKPALHARFPGVKEFSEMIVDLNELIKPRLQVMDAVIGMEGDGPHTGEPRKIGAILASGDYSALDSVAARLMAFEPRSIGTIRAAMERGLVEKDLSDVLTLGDRIEDFIVPDFKRPTTLDAERGFAKGRMSSALMSLIKAYSLRPVVLKDKCTGCAQCVQICPRKTIRMISGKASVRSKDCIRCYCCHEMCSQKAIVLRRSYGGRVMARAIERRSKGP
jgi:uncharacterized protein (DUF362 family)/Pyruvate/2-oxoacid:ferredoxin oxidoreductase delta subunit